MGFDEFTSKVVEKEMQRLVDRVPPNVRDKVNNSYEIKAQNVTLYENRPSWQEPDNPDKWTKLAIAQFRFDSDHGTWSLYWQRANGKWLLLEGVAPTAHLSQLVDEVMTNATGVFWG